LLLVLANKPAHLPRRQSQPCRDRVLLELPVDKSLNAFEPIQFAHRHGHLWYPDHGPISQTVKTISGEWTTGAKADIST